MQIFADVKINARVNLYVKFSMVSAITRYLEMRQDSKYF